LHNTCLQKQLYLMQKAVEKIEEEGKKRNIDPEFIKLVKEEIYGV